MSRLRPALLLGCLVSAIGLGGPPAAQAAPGPELTVTPAQLSTALECSGPLQGLTRDPVLLTPAFSTAQQSYGFNYRRQLPQIGVTTCTLNLPDIGYGDLQTSAEYVVAAVRRMSDERGGGKVVLMGHQHGAIDELWALKFWPDLAAKVSDYIALAAPFHGTSTAASGCHALNSCAASAWQIATGSKFLAALNARPLPAGPSYTSISTAYDELILPQPTTSLLAGAKNVVIQSICPLRPIEHFSILFDNVTYRLVVDALTHVGPADPARISRLYCLGSLYLPGIDARQAPAMFSAAAGTFANAFTTPSVKAEPALRSYATAS